LCKTGRELEDVGRSLSWRALGNFVRHLPTDSATMRDVRPEIAEWGTVVKTNEILADIFDVLSMINSNLVALGNRKQAKQPKLYPRPGAKPKDEQHFGSGALPPAELRRWIEEKRRAHG